MYREGERVEDETVCNQKCWTAWMSAYTPTLANVGDVETVSALRMRYSFCQEADMESIECRVVGETTHAQRSGQNVTCRLPEGLVNRYLHPECRTNTGCYCRWSDLQRHGVGHCDGSHILTISISNCCSKDDTDSW
nr:hypothetical protein BaRGS_004979 [Batillaria attramentaria]